MADTTSDAAQILLLRKQVTDLEALIKQQFTATSKDTLRDLVIDINAFKASFINTVKEMVTTSDNDVVKLRDNFAARFAEITAKVAAEEKKLEQEVANFRTNATKLYSISADNIGKLEDLIKRSATATGTELKRMEGEISTFIAASSANIAASFKGNEQLFGEQLKSMLSHAQSFEEVKEKYGETVANALIADGKEIKSKEDLDKAIKNLTVTEKMVTDNAEKYARLLFDNTQKIYLQTIAVTKLTEEKKKLNEIEKLINKNADTQVQGFEDMNKAISKYTDKFASSQPTIIGGMIKSTLAFNLANHEAGKFASSLTDGIGKWKDAFLDYGVSIDRVMGFIHDKVIKSTFDMAKAFAEVNKQTGGFGKEFGQAAVRTDFGLSGFRGAPLAMYGASVKELGDAYSALSNTLGTFNNMTEKQQYLLAANSVSMRTLGVSAENYAKSVSTFMAVMGRTAEDSRYAVEALARDAIAMGRNVGEYLKEYQNSLSKIMGYGREAKEVFKDLNAFIQSSKGVLTSSDLLNFTESFNNFEGAAEQVGKLNAMLGGTSINILDMMKADPSERLIKVKRAANEAGLEFDKLNVGYKRLLAEAFGGDMEKAAAFYKMDLEEAYEYMNKMEASEEELEKRKRASIAAQEKLNAALQNMQIIFTPVINMVSALGNIILRVQKMIGGGWTGFLVLTGLIATAVYAWNRFRNSVSLLINELVTGMYAAGVAARGAEFEVEKLIASLSAAARQAGLVRMEMSGIKSQGILAQTGPMSGMGKAMGALALFSLLGNVAAPKIEQATEDNTPYDKINTIGPGLIMPNGQVIQTPEHFVYRAGAGVTGVDPKDVLAGAAPGESAVINNSSNTSVSSNSTSTKGEWVTNFLGPESPMVKSVEAIPYMLARTQSTFESSNTLASSATMRDEKKEGSYIERLVSTIFNTQKQESTQLLAGPQQPPAVHKHQIIINNRIIDALAEVTSEASMDRVLRTS
jgi:hypothetical protein